MTPTVKAAVHNCIIKHPHAIESPIKNYWVMITGSVKNKPLYSKDITTNFFQRAS